MTDPPPLVLTSLHREGRSFRCKPREHNMFDTTKVNPCASLVTAPHVMMGDVVLTEEGAVLYVTTAVDVYQGQDGYVVLRGVDVTGAPSSTSYYLGEWIEILGNLR